jgi:GNAT superfamily N-acetyltransferase
MYTIGERPELAERRYDINPKSWPPFMLHDPVAAQYWGCLFKDFAPFQFVLCDDHESIIAMGNSIPLVWNDTVESLPDGWDAELEQGVQDREAGRTPNTLGALSITIALEHQGQGLSRMMLQHMRRIAAEHGLHDLIAPVRPTLKAHYPLTPIERYAAWTTPDGAPFDPWLRTHWRLGARIMRLVPQSMIIEAPLRSGKHGQPCASPTTMRFPDSGPYVVPGALQPILIDRERDAGRYEDPNVWMRHIIDPR